MYKTNKKFNRIDWVYAEYANSSEISLTEFINAVNKAYYSNSVNLYTSRYVKDIHQEYLRMFDHLDINNTHEKKYIVDIGGGAGFEFGWFAQDIVHCNGSTDYIEAYGRNEATGGSWDADSLLNEGDDCFMAIIKVA